MSASHTVLESEGTGLLALGRPDDVARLIENGRELRLAAVGLVTDGGLVCVATWPAWVLQGVERA